MSVIVMPSVLHAEKNKFQDSLTLNLTVKDIMISEHTIYSFTVKIENENCKICKIYLYLYRLCKVVGVWGIAFTELITF